jgi:site-specific DNA-methyltransferase (cytosine-N4-specific)
MAGYTDLVASLPDPYYRATLGSAYLGDAIDLLSRLPDDSIDLIMTSPPFALQRKKEYGNVSPEDYVEWFDAFANQFWRVLKEDGSLVVHIADSWTEGLPTKSLYHFRLLTHLCLRENRPFHLAQDFYWFNPARLPTPAEWVTVRRIRVKDAVDHLWWLSKSPYPKADNRAILKAYSRSMKDLLKNGYVPKLRPSGHDISGKFQNDRGGAIPPNLLMMGNTESNSHYLRSCRAAGVKPHPARYPSGIPQFFIRFLSSQNDVVLDPFAGSNVTGIAAQQLGRYWIAFEILEDYLKGSMFRFSGDGVQSTYELYQTRPSRQHRLLDKASTGD